MSISLDTVDRQQKRWLKVVNLHKKNGKRRIFASDVQAVHRVAEVAARDVVMQWNTIGACSPK